MSISTTAWQVHYDGAFDLEVELLVQADAFRKGLDPADEAMIIGHAHGPL